MYKNRIAATLALGALTAATPALAQLPRQPAPHGMVEVASGGGTGGRILTSRMGGTTSARKILAALKMVSAEYFDKPFTVTRAFADKHDHNLQAAFTARLKGVPVHGIASVAMQKEGGQGTLIFDNAQSFAKSFHALVARQNRGGAGQGGGTGASEVTLTRRTAPDGSCEISLPPGFQITDSYKGVLDIVGPKNAQMGLGGHFVCTRYEAASMFPGIPPVDFDDPVRAMMDFVHYMGQKAGVSSQIKILDARPIPDWNPGRAAYIRYNIRYSGKSVEGFGLFCIAPTDINQAMYYQSFIAAPSATYRSQFPGMMKAWGTWSINPGVFQERLMAAMQSMRGMSDIITSGHANREQSEARVFEAWSDCMRDQTTWGHPDTGAHYKVSNVLTNDGGTPYVGDVALQAVPLSGL